MCDQRWRTSSLKLSVPYEKGTTIKSDSKTGWKQFESRGTYSLKVPTAPSLKATQTNCINHPRTKRSNLCNYNILNLDVGLPTCTVYTKRNWELLLYVRVWGDLTYRLDECVSSCSRFFPSRVYVPINQSSNIEFPFESNKKNRSRLLHENASHSIFQP